MLRFSALAVSIGVFVMGCTSNSASSSSGSTGDAGTGAKPATLTCAGIFDCAQACGENNEACDNNCLSQGSPAAQTAVNAVAKCFTDNSCADADCFKEKCPNELQACVDSAKAGTSEPITGDPPAGNVPSEMVGKWAAREVLWEFSANGAANRLTKGKVGGCTSQRLETGTATVSGNTVTVYFTSSKVTVCDSPGNSSNYQPNSEGFTWRSGKTTDGAPTLFLQEQKCRYDDPKAAEFYCGTAFDKID